MTRSVQLAVLCSVVLCLSPRTGPAGTRDFSTNAAVACGQTITADTTLDADLLCPPSTQYALVLGASNITLDLGGHRISGQAPEGDTASAGVHATGVEGIAVKNGSIEGFGLGVSLIGVRNAIVENLTLRGGSIGVLFAFAGTCDPVASPSNGQVLNSRFSDQQLWGVAVQCSTRAEITGSHFSMVSGHGVGIQADAPFPGAVTGLTVTSCTFEGGAFGTEFRGITQSTVTNNVMNGSSVYGIELQQSPGCFSPLPGWQCFSSTANRIADNRALGNGTDLYHCETCTGNTWERNACATRQGAEIPTCSAPPFVFLGTRTKTVRADTGAFVSSAGVTYTLTLTNSGNAAQADNPGHELVDTLPSALALVSAEATSGTATADASTNTVTWDGSLRSGGSVAIRIHTLIQPTVAPGTIIANQAIVSYDADANGTNETTTLTDDPAARGANDPTSFVVVSPPTDLYTLTPCRLLDTRDATGTFGGPALAAGGDRIFPIFGQCGIPTIARALSANLTVTQPTAQGNLRLYPAGTPLPLVSSINYVAGQTRANNAIAPLNGLGELAVRCSQASGTTHFILDVNGYFEEPAEVCVPAIAGDNSAALQAVLNTGANLVLCPGQTYRLTVGLRYTTANQAIYTRGSPVAESSQARLEWASPDADHVVFADGQTLQLRGIQLHHVTVDGMRDLYGGFKRVDIFGMVELLGTPDAYVAYNHLKNPRNNDPGSTLSIYPDQGCLGVLVVHNSIGPAGQSDGTWTDGITYSCHAGEVAHNTITDATDGAIVIVGGEGSRIHDNLILAESRRVIAAIHMVSGSSFNGTEVYRNTIRSSTGGRIKVGIAMGMIGFGGNYPMCRQSQYVEGGAVYENHLEGPNFGYGYVLNGVRNWHFHDNSAVGTYGGPLPDGCSGDVAAPRAFACQIETVNDGVCPAQITAGDMISYPENVDGVPIPATRN